MFEKVLIPFDFSKGSYYAVQCLTKIPPVREVVLLHIVYNKYSRKGTGRLGPEVDYARLRLEEIKKGLATPGREVRTIAEEIPAGDVVDVINRTTTNEGISLTLMGRRGHGIIESLLLGSVSSDVLRFGKTDLILVSSPKPDDVMGGDRDIPCPDLFSHVMICTDFSEPEIGLVCSREFPWIQQVTLFHVVTSGDSEEEVQAAVDAAGKRLLMMKDAFTALHIPAESRVRVGEAAEEILSFARQEDISLILLKSAGKRGLLTTLLGSTTAHVARNAQKPVMVVKRAPPGET